MSRLRGYYVKRIGNHRGAPRFWLEGSQAARAGFLPGQKYDVVIDGHTVVLQANKDGSRVVSAKKKGDRDHPVIDINSKELLAAFDGMAAVRVVVANDAIYLLPLASELRKQERFQRIRRKIESGDPLLLGSLSHGGGVLSHAVHEGLKQAGVRTRLAFANEIREDLIEQAAEMNDAWDENTIPVSAPMQEFALDDKASAHIPRVDLLEMGLPCSGASVAGRAKRGLDMPEAHPEVGHLVVSALIILNKTQAAVVLLENVPQYATSASAHILRHQLRDMGYTVHEAILNGKDFGCLENRERWCMVATTEGLEFSFDQLQPTVTVVKRLGDFLDNVPEDDPRWSAFKYLKDKEARDAADGKGFRMQTVTPGSTSVPTIRKGYHKGGSTDPYLRHPTNPELLRKFSAAEHARIKGVPDHLVEGLSETTAHELLGQGIIYDPFQAVGNRIGSSLIAQFRDKVRSIGSQAGEQAALRKQKVSG